MVTAEVFDFNPEGSRSSEVGSRWKPGGPTWGNSSQCPVCGSDGGPSYNSEGPAYETFEGPECELVWQPATCGACGAEWSESYYLMGAWIEDAAGVDAEPTGGGGVRVYAGSLLDAALDVLAAAGAPGVEARSLALRTLGDSVRAVIGFDGEAELTRRRAALGVEPGDVQ